LAASAGSFIATDITFKYLREQTLQDTWYSLLSKSAHGHTNLFGLLHISLGLTMPYARWSQIIRVIQTIGLSLGSFAMSVLMVVRGLKPPSDGIEIVGMSIGICLSAALAAIVIQAMGLCLRIRD
jgi:ABC-type nickel/cobalt efflux system permease component RcnA